jgi:hypothetical protein
MSSIDEGILERSVLTQESAKSPDLRIRRDP